MALRNVIFIGFIGPIVLATYLPAWKRRIPVLLEYAAGAALLYPIVLAFITGSAFQLRARDWLYPGAAANFLIAHGVTGHIFNTYEQGGYLMWRLWPKIQVFIDGRALNESVYNDYRHIIYNADYQGGQTTQQLLQQYGINTIVINGFDFVGELNLLGAALADPSQKEWKLVFRDEKELIYMRDPPPGLKVFPSLDALVSLEAQCDRNMKFGLNGRCAHSLGLMFYRIRDAVRARKWLATSLDINSSDVLTRRYMQRLTAAGH